MVKDFCQRLTVTKIRKSDGSVENGKGGELRRSGGSHLDNGKENRLCLGICSLFILFLVQV